MTPGVGSRGLLIPETRYPKPDTLFYVLHLLLESIDRPLDFHDVPGDLRIIGLARDRIGLPQHLLSNKVQLPPCMLAGAAGLFEGIEVAGQTLNLFADVRALGE